MIKVGREFGRLARPVVSILNGRYIQHRHLQGLLYYWDTQEIHLFHGAVPVHVGSISCAWASHASPIAVVFTCWPKGLPCFLPVPWEAVKALSPPGRSGLKARCMPRADATCPLVFQ